MPDIGNLAGEQIPSGSPIRDLVVADFTLSRRIVDAPAMSPFRIVFDAKGGSVTISCGTAPAKSAFTRFASLLSPRAMRWVPSSQTSPGCDIAI
jgi:hypothetical protein